MQRRRCCPCSPLVKIQAPPLQHFLSSPLHSNGGWCVFRRKNPNETESMLSFFVQFVAAFLPFEISLFANISSVQYSDIVVRVFSVKIFVPSVLLRVYSGYIFFVFSLSGVDSVLRLPLGALSECVSFLLIFNASWICFTCFCVLTGCLLPSRWTFMCSSRKERSHLSEMEDESGETNCEMRNFLRMFFECAWKSRNDGKSREINY